MCGRGWSPEQLEAMARSLAHRGPDATGRHVDVAGGAGLAHTRLSILDLSEAGRQPMCDPEGRWWITFNGEVYNYLELRAELEGDWEFRTGTDTEVLLAAFRKWGRDCLPRLIGMFAFAVWDARERTLFAARDRFGVKPLYVATRPEGVWLASEIKALHAAGLARTPNKQTCATYLVSGSRRLAAVVGAAGPGVGFVV
jgi:asparagine synthase (glutamine-hydrolysing)